jgi:hypothetical protein
MHDRLSYYSDSDGTVVITRPPTGEGDRSPPVAARIYDPTYALGTVP